MAEELSDTEIIERAFKEYGMPVREKESAPKKGGANLTASQAEAIGEKIYAQMEDVPAVEEDPYMDRGGYTVPGTERPEGTTDTLSYMFDQVKLELGSLVRRMTPDMFDSRSQESLKGYLENAKETGDYSLSVSDLNEEQAQFDAEVATDLVGYEGFQARDGTQKLAGMGARGLADPMNLVGVGGTTVARKGVSALTEFLFGAGTYMVAGTTGEAVREATGSELLSNIASVTSGAGLGATRAATSTGFNRIRRARHTASEDVPVRIRDTEAARAQTSKEDFWNMDAPPPARDGELPRAEAVDRPDGGEFSTAAARERAEEALVGMELNNVLMEAKRVDPGFEAKVKQAQKINSAIPDIELPPFMAMADNPILRKDFERLYATNSEFRANVQTVLKSVKKKLKKNVKVGSKPDEATLEKRARAVSESAVRDLQYKLDKFDNQMSIKMKKLGDRLISNKVSQAEVGNEATKLLNEHRAKVYDTMKPQYEKLLRSYGRQRIPARNVEGVWNNVFSLYSRDRFGTMPTTQRKLLSLWGPKKNSQGKKVFRNVTMRDVDSLKRAINKDLRNPKMEPETRTKLLEMKRALFSQVKKAQPEFFREYSKIDAEYKRRILPLSEAGVKNLDAATFATSVGERLTRFDQAADFIDAVGPAGKKIVEDALLVKAFGGLYAKDGSVNPEFLRKFVTNHRAVLDLVPELKQRMSTVRDAVNEIENARAKIQSAYNEKSAEYTEGYFRAVEGRRLDQVADDIIGNKGKSADYLRSIEKMRQRDPQAADMAVTGIRQALVDKAFQGALKQKKGGVVDFMKKHQGEFDRWFSKGYVKKLDRLAKAADLVAAATPKSEKINYDAAASDRVKQATGVSVESIIGTARNMVMSVPRKFLHITSKMFLETARRKRDQHIMDMFLAVDGIPSLEKQLQSMDVKIEKGDLVAAQAQAMDVAREFSKWAWLRAFKGGALAANATQEEYDMFVQDDKEAERLRFIYEQSRPTGEE